MNQKLSTKVISRDADYKQAIQTSTITLDYERSSHLINAITKEEEIRRLQTQALLLQDDIDNLNDHLADEEDRADHLTEQLDEAIGSIDVFETENQRLEMDLRAKVRELEITRTELSAMQTVSTDSTKVLTEKLALQREIAVLKPEIASLRAESASNRELLGQKLALERQLATFQVELENAQRSAKRAMARVGGNSHDQSEYDAQIDELEKKLRESKLARKDAERDLEQMMQELESERRAARKAGGKKDAVDGEVEELRDVVDELKRQLAAEKKKAGKKPSASEPEHDSQAIAELQSRIKELDKSLIVEKREREKADKALQKEQAAWEAQKSLLDDKLAQFRTKLRSTKEKLKETEEQLEAASSRGSAQAEDYAPAGKKGKKRSAAKMDPDAVLGTPGVEPPAKRGKRGAAAVVAARNAVPGDKSMFSITPFLNKTIAMTETEFSDAEAPVLDKSDDAAAAEIEAVDLAIDLDMAAEDIDVSTPTAAASKKQKDKPKPLKKQTLTKSKPLKQASSSKHNAKPTASKQAERRKTARAPELEKVVEENSQLESQESHGSTSTQPIAIPDITATMNLPLAESTRHLPTQTLQLTLEPTTSEVSHEPSKKPFLKPRKSLLNFPSVTSNPSETTTITTTAINQKSKSSIAGFGGAIVAKKRKLLGSSLGSSFLADSQSEAPSKAAATIFDEDDEGAGMPSKPIPGRGLFGKKALGRPLAGKGAPKGMMALGASGSSMLVADNGFQFSPLKKDRRRAAGEASMLGQ